MNLPMKYFFLICLCYFLFSCGNHNKTSSELSANFIKTNLPAGITSLDPCYASSLENIKVVRQLFDGLVELDEHLRVQPAIAQRWEISDDGTVYTFYLRHDVYFHDNPAFPGKTGRKVTAYDVEYSFFRVWDEKNASPGRWIFNHLAPDKQNKHMGFEALNDSTFRIYLKQPFPPMLSLLAMPYCYVVPHEAIELYGEDFRRNPVGTGPFMFKYWEEGVKLILLRNPRYFQKDTSQQPLPHAEGIHFYFIKDEEIAFFELLKGNLDYISGLHGSVKKVILTDNGELKDAYKHKLIFTKKTFLNTEYLGFLIDPKNPAVNNSPITSKYFRQAINYALDRKKMIHYLKQNIGIPAEWGFVPTGIGTYKKEKMEGYEYNPQKASMLLQKAGFSQTSPSPITLYTTAQYLDLCEYIQHQLQEVGIPIKIEVNTAGIHAEMVAKKQALFFRKSWVADYPDPENFLALFYGKNHAPMGPNYTHYQNPQYDVLYETALRTSNEQERNILYQKMEKMIMEDAPVIPLYYDQLVILSTPSLHSLKINAMSIPDLKWARKSNPQ